MDVRLLAVSDEVEPQLLDQRTVAALGRIDLLIGCGDLPADYLDGLGTLYNVPLLFVRGNHDPPGRQGDYPPGGEIVRAVPAVHDRGQARRPGRQVRDTQHTLGCFLRDRRGCRAPAPPANRKDRLRDPAVPAPGSTQRRH